MQAISGVVPRLKRKLSNPFLRNFGWLSGAQVVMRILRLGVTVVLARFLTMEDYGLAAIVMTVTEFTRILTDVGVMAKIIQAEEEELEKLCDAAYWLSWTVFLSLFVVQCLLAFPIGWFYNKSDLILPICVAALPYLVCPLCDVQRALIHRENRLKITAICSTVFSAVVYALTIALAIQGMGLWAIVLPPAICAPIGVAIYYSNHSWRPTKPFTTKHWGEILHFGKNIAGVQVLGTLRNNLDYLIVGRFIGIEELGIYYFGFNAGLGISLSIIDSISGALYPHLCAARSNWSQFRQSYFSSLKTIALVIIPFVLLQSSMAPFYVPIVFGEKWVVAIPILVLICLSAIPRPFSSAASQLLMAAGRPDLDLRWNVVFTSLFAGALLIGVQWQSLGVAIAVLLVHWICLPLYSLWATRFVLTKLVPR